MSEQVTSYFVKTEALLAQTKRIKQECQKHFYGALTSKQRAAMATIQEQSVLKFIADLKFQKENEVEQTNEQVQFYR